MCRLTLKRQRVMATQVRVRRSQASHKKEAEILQIAGQSPRDPWLACRHSRLIAPTAKADSIDIDLDDGSDNSTGFGLRFQPKIPPDLLNNLLNDEGLRSRFKSFVEFKVNELIAGFAQQTNGEGIGWQLLFHVTTCASL